MMADDTLDDRALIRQAVAGSEFAFAQLYRAYVSPVFWIAHGLMHDRSDAEDVTQETFVTAWAKLRSLDLQGDSLLPWLATICRFTAANRLRARGRARTVPLDEDPPSSAGRSMDVEQQVIDAVTVEAILRHVASLSALDREIFRLCAAEGYSYRDAALALGVAHGVVRNRLSRIRLRVRTAVNGEEN